MNTTRSVRPLVRPTAVHNASALEVALFLLAGLPVLGGCAECHEELFSGSGLAPLGQQQRYEFLLGSGVAKLPLAAGGVVDRLSIFRATGSAPGCPVRPAPPAWERVASSNPDVFTVAEQASEEPLSSIRKFSLTSGTEGEADVLLLDARDAIVDSHRVLVRRTTAIRVPAPQSGTTLLMEDSIGWDRFQTFAGEQRTYGVGALRYSFRGNLKGVSAPEGYAGWDAGWFRGTAGLGTVVATSAEGLSGSRDWTIVTYDDVAAISLEAGGGRYGPPGSASQHDWRVILRAAGLDKDRRLILGAQCDWGMFPDGWVVNVLGPDPQCDGSSVCTAYAVISARGSHVLTCTMGNAVASITVQGPPT